MVVDQELLSGYAAVDQAGERTEDRGVLRVDDVRPLPQKKDERLKKKHDVAQRSKISWTVKDGHADSLASHGLGQLVHAKTERPPDQK